MQNSRDFYPRVAGFFTLKSGDFYPRGFGIFEKSEDFYPRDLAFGIFGHFYLGIFWEWGFFGVGDFSGIGIYFRGMISRGFLPPGSGFFFVGWDNPTKSHLWLRMRTLHTRLQNHWNQKEDFYYARIINFFNASGKNKCTIRLAGFL